MPFKKKLLQKVRLLYVEDDKESRLRTTAFLESYFSEVIAASDGEEAIALYKNRAPDMILTDIRMPNMGGIELVREIRRHDTAIPIIMLTAHCDTDLLLDAVKLKLDDYLVKPFQKENLLRALAKGAKNLPYFSDRIHTFEDGTTYVFAKKAVCSGNREQHLTRHESDLMELLVCKTGDVVTYEEIEAYVYHGEYMSPDAIKTLVKKLRKKLPDGVITNIVNIGYQLA